MSGGCRTPTIWGSISIVQDVVNARLSKRRKLFDYLPNFSSDGRAAGTNGADVFLPQVGSLIPHGLSGFADLHAP
jgi:hypothetical protein